MSTFDLLEHSFGVLWSRMQREPTITCPRCEAPVFTRPVPRSPSTDLDTSVEWWCPRCGDLHQSGNLSSLALNHPRGFAFWRDEGQIRIEPLRKTTVRGDAAILITFASVQRTASITFASTPDATRLLLIDDQTHSIP